MKQIFQNFLQQHYPSAQLSDRLSMGGKIHLRFELGLGHSNGTKERVEQATERAKILFEETFSDKTQKLWMLAYEYTSEVEMYKENNPYFHTLLFPSDSGNIVQFEESYEDEGEQNSVRIILGHLSQMEFDVENILRGIANFDMGFVPRITQCVYFFCPKTLNMFYMYDDRGCLVWSDEAEKLRPMFEKYDAWIVEYHRATIEKQFQ